jgi:undecaprenyl-diphosphatase
LIATILSAFVSLALGRLLAHELPFRIRPLFDQSLTFAFPLADANQSLRTWSAFPSDHAMLWSAVATGIYLCSKRIGLLAIIFTAVFICFPRVYLGLHHPTDVLAGAFLGIAVTLILTRESICSFLVRPFDRWSTMSPQSFYLIAFIASYGFATTFAEARTLATSLGKYVGHGPRVEAQNPIPSPSAFAYASTPKIGGVASAQNPQLADSTPKSSW